MNRSRVSASLREMSVVLVAALLAVLAGVSPAAAQAQMPDPSLISGKALPDGSAPVGTVSVRVIRGGWANNVANQPVEFTIDGKTRSVKTDSEGRAVVSGLKAGTNVKTAVVVDGARIESDGVTLAESGIRFVLVAVDPDAAKRAAEERALAAGPAVKGIVVLAPTSQVIAELQDDRLNVFYSLDILNTARVSVDTGGPLVFDLPTGALSASLIDGSSKQGTVIGPRLTVTGPFAPGTTSVQVGFEMPISGGTVEISQRWPAALQQVTVVMPKSGVLDLQSPQLTAKQSATNQGQPIVMATGPAIPAGGTLTFEITGLPHTATWPRNLALVLAGLIMLSGIWAAVFVK